MLIPSWPGFGEERVSLTDWFYRIAPHGLWGCEGLVYRIVWVVRVGGPGLWVHGLSGGWCQSKGSEVPRRISGDLHLLSAAATTF